MFRVAFPDLKITIEDLIVEGTKSARGPPVAEASWAAIRHSSDRPRNCDERFDNGSVRRRPLSGKPGKERRDEFDESIRVVSGPR